MTMKRRRKAAPVAAFLGTLCALLLLHSPLSGQQKQIDWTKISPAFEGATYVKDAAVCEGCHEKTAHKFAGSGHARMFRSGDTPAQGDCESCHGPRSKHVEDEKPVATWSKLTTGKQSAVCLQCHEKGARMSWRGGTHAAADVSCTACHDAKAPVGQQGMKVSRVRSETCYSCHSAVRAEMSKASHHPVREGKMECSSCHNVHGSNASLLKTATANDTCNGCHSEKRGPYVWEHAPVRETCSNCHNAHGSSNRQLLNKKDSFLCLQCHSYGGHINLPRYNRTSNPTGQGCVNCHMSVHGSNHPSGAKLTR